ncbi:MAG: 50S ribosomal protein L23 [Gammaproteobacteria bacterium]|nr:50S ribosomal protein L23 [Gammaproteobacteria bacterium]
MNQERLLKVILSPHISEKSTVASEKRHQYVFRVINDATKSEVKDAIEFLFNTKVKSVRIVNVRPKKKMFRSMEGTRKGWKKAYIALYANQKLDMIGAQ